MTLMITYFPSIKKKKATNPTPLISVLLESTFPFEVLTQVTTNQKAY